MKSLMSKVLVVLVILIYVIVATYWLFNHFEETKSKEEAIEKVYRRGMLDGVKLLYDDDFASDVVVIDSIMAKYQSLAEEENYRLR